MACERRVRFVVGPDYLGAIVVGEAADTAGEGDHPIIVCLGRCLWEGDGW